MRRTIARTSSAGQGALVSIDGASPETGWIYSAIRAVSTLPLEPELAGVTEDNATKRDTPAMV